MTNIRRKISFQNFFEDTKATFKACKKPKREPNYVSNSGSCYWYGEDKKGKYVIRYSDHWSEIDNKGDIVDCIRLYFDSNDSRVDFDPNLTIDPNLYPDYKVEIKNIRRNVASCNWSLNIPGEKLSGAGKAYLHNFTTMEPQILKHFN